VITQGALARAACIANAADPPETLAASPPPDAPDFLAITGPTGVGKTRLSLRVASILDGEIVSADSRQIYRGMDVGTAKPTPAQRSAVPHHGLDIRNPDERYSAGEFGRDARRWIAEIASRGRVPIVAGGTGFYLKSLTDPIFREPPLDPERRQALESFLDTQSVPEMKRGVQALDPARHRPAAAGGRQRLRRTATVALLSGRSLSWWHRHASEDGVALRAVVCVLEMDPATLAARINRRVRAMAEQGWVPETERLLAAGYHPGAPGMNGVGYREIAEHVAGRISLEEAIERTQRATRRYARRQRTWFRRQLPSDVVRVDAATDADLCARAVVGAWRSAVARPTGGPTSSIPAARKRVS